MQRLVELLTEIDQSSLPDEDYDYVLRSDDHVNISEIQSLACDLFIQEGSPLFDDMDMLHKQHGYFIFPGERDRFGWVTACLQTKKGIIVFG
jgi:hypothetical protein